MKYVSWRDRARPIIAQVLAETAGQDEKAIRRALYEAYPWHERRMYPYAVWLSEIKRQRRLPQDRPEAPGGLMALMEGE